MTQKYIIIFSFSVLASVFLGAVVAGASLRLSDREKSILRYGEVTQAMNQLHAESNELRSLIESKGEKWQELSEEKARLEKELF